MKDTRAAFLWITNILEELKIPYVILGGFAARIYGASRDLSDIDLEVSEQSFEVILQRVKQFVIFGPARYQDSNWDVNLITLSYKEQEIDLASTAALIFNKISNKWEILGTNLDNVVYLKIFEKEAPVVTRDFLIRYKKKLGREVDMEDIRLLDYSVL